MKEPDFVHRLTDVVALVLPVAYSTAQRMPTWLKLSIGIIIGLVPPVTAGVISAIVTIRLNEAEISNSRQQHATELQNLRESIGWRFQQINIRIDGIHEDLRDLRRAYVLQNNIKEGQ